MDNGTRLMLCIIAGVFIYLLVSNNNNKKSVEKFSGGNVTNSPMLNNALKERMQQRTEWLENNAPPNPISQVMENNMNDIIASTGAPLELPNDSDVMTMAPVQNINNISEELDDPVTTAPSVNNNMTSADAVIGSNTDKMYSEINKFDLGNKDPSKVAQSISEKNIDRVLPNDLLPLNSDDNSWLELQNDSNLLDAGHHFGINTVGTTLRNANYSLRSEIPNPRIQVSPWGQSTIEPDLTRKPLEIGCDGNSEVINNNEGVLIN